MATAIQYAMLGKDGRYRKRNGGLTTSLSRANIVDTKKAAELIAEEYVGDYIPVYLSTADLSVPPPIQSVWLVKRYCQIYGLSIYGPYFTAGEASSMFNSIIWESDHSLLGKFEQTYEYSTVTAENRLGDKLEICEVKRAKL